MRDVPDSMKEAWSSGDFTGDRRPMARVTVQHPTFTTRSVGSSRYSHFFNPTDLPKEIPNILSVSWDVDVDSDTGTCTVQALNTKPLELGEEPPNEDFDYPGYYTPQHGASAYSSAWNHEPNEWKGMLLPDNLIRTYEGYGFDPDVCPSRDPHLVQTGVWRIDEVDLGHDGTITISCRDVGSILIDQIAFPPIVPFEAGPTNEEYPSGMYSYPIQFQSFNESTINDVPMNPQEVPLTFDDSSNTPYVSSKNAEVYDHRPSEAFDGDIYSFWWSIGNARPDQGYSYEWIQGKCNSSTVTSIRFYSWGTQYTVFASVYADGEWKGANKIPYNPNHPASAPNGSDIQYVVSGHVPDDANAQEHELVFPEPIENVTKVRLTFTNLWFSATGTYKYRADCRELTAWGGQLSREVTTVQEYKNYHDYTDIVKHFLAIGGFWWPSGAYQLDCDGGQISHPYTKEDEAMTIEGGRVWGDIKLAGTGGPAPLDVDVWDKKPLMECIRYVAEILGYLSYVDETGGFVFRPPNIYRKGNIFRTISRQSGEYTTDMVQIREEHSLRSLSSKLSSRNVRERVFVANVDGRFGHMAAGWNPNPTGLRRVGGWTDENFQKEEEAKVMAEMITLRQLFTYRTDSLQIPGYPRIQVDDQVQIFERITSEGFIHYVKGISSNNNLVEGEWTYDLTTHWLGERPFERWLFDPKKLSRETQYFLQGLYRISEDPV